MRNLKTQYEYYSSDDKSENPLSFNGATQNIDPDSNYYTTKIIDAVLKNEGQRQKLIIPGDLKITGDVVLSNDLELKEENKLDGINGNPIENWNPQRMTHSRWQNVPQVNVHSENVIKANTIGAVWDIHVDGTLTNVNNNTGKTEIGRIYRDGGTLNVHPHVHIFGAINLSSDDGSPYNRGDDSNEHGYIYRDNESVRINDD